MPEKRAVKADGAPYLRIERLTKRFGSFLALKDISLEIYPGEFVCFLGPSGCGKTTLLRAIAGLDIQTSGRIFQADREISNLPASARDFGIVFQSYALFPNLTVAANVGYGLVSHGVPRVEIATRVDELLRLVGLPDSGRKYPAQLSGGQQQRVAVARALALSPGLLLLDEPLSALDARVRAYLRIEIRRLHQRIGVTTIMVTHDQEEALTMADRIVVMNQGVIEQVGTPTEVYRKPASAFVADFVGTTNFLPAVVVAPGRVRVGRIDLACELDVRPGPGHDVTLAIRPEDVVVRNVVAGTINTFTARVTEIEFLGSFCRVGLAITGADPVLLADFSINVVRDLAIAEGKQMLIALPPDRLRVFPRAPQEP
jgi:iron(III) transport system ATP-binding protein